MTLKTVHTESWPEIDLPADLLKTSRTVPHAFVRSALFSSRKFSGDAVRAQASETSPIPIAAQSNYTLLQLAGERLDQGDCDVYAWLLTRAYRRGLAGKAEARIYFTRGEALRELGRARGTQSFKLFEESLMRLYRADISYEIPHATGRTRLISSLEKSTKDSNKKFDYEVIISAKAGDFFRENDFKALADAEREQLSDYLTKWLYAFYSSHDNPFQITTDFVKKLADRTSMQESKWRTTLDKSLERVKQVTGWPVCEVREYDNVAPRVVVAKGAQPPRRPKPEENSDNI